MPLSHQGKKNPTPHPPTSKADPIFSWRYTPVHALVQICLCSLSTNTGSADTAQAWQLEEMKHNPSLAAQGHEA